MKLLGLYITTCAQQERAELVNRMIDYDRTEAHAEVRGLKSALKQSEKDYEQALEECDVQRGLVRSGSIQISKLLNEKHSRDAQNSNYTG